MGIFEQKKEFSRGELKDTLRKDSGAIPKTGGKKFYEADRKKMEQDVFGSKYGSQISKNDYRSAVSQLERDKAKAENPQDKTAIGQKIEYLKRLGGKI